MIPKTGSGSLRLEPKNKGNDMMKSEDRRRYAAKEEGR